MVVAFNGRRFGRRVKALVIDEAFPRSLRIAGCSSVDSDCHTYADGIEVTGSGAT
jgi:hypothetical protein